jgi:hypothetical protein
MLSLTIRPLPCPGFAFSNTSVQSQLSLLEDIPHSFMKDRCVHDIFYTLLFDHIGNTFWNIFYIIEPSFDAGTVTGTRQIFCFENI